MIKEEIIPFEVFSKKTGKTLELAMESLILTGKIIPAGAQLIVEHSFVCNEKKPVEVIYSFGLPRDATLRRFKVKGKDFLVDSELKTRKEVDKIYEEAIEKGYLGVKAQRYRDGVINLTVGNIRKGEEIKVHLEMLAGVNNRDNGFRFMFPFTLAPCYHRNARASEIEPGAGEIELPGNEFGDVFLPTYKKDSNNLHTIGFNLEITLPNEITEISSPSHHIHINRIKPDTSTVTLSTEKDIPNRDLVLDVKTREAITYAYGEKDSEGRIHFYALFPSKSFQQVKTTKKKVATVLVIDRSGSMDGLPLKQAKRAVKACLSALNKEDRFAIVAFDSTLEIYKHSMLNANKENIEGAFRFINYIKARGGTELSLALGKATEILKISGVRDGNIFVITDGQVYGTEDILREAKENNIRIYCLGIGSASQDHFLNVLTKETSGNGVFITPRERVENEALKIFGSIKTGLGIISDYAFKGFKDIIAEPDFSGAIYEGKPLLIFGETIESTSGNIELKILRNGKEFQKILPLDIEVSEKEGFLKLLRGARIIDEIESNIGKFTDISTKYKSAMKKLTEISMKYGLASRAIGLVAVIKRKSIKNETPITKIVPVGMPEDIQWGAYFEAEVAQISSSPTFLRKRASYPREVRKISEHLFMKEETEHTEKLLEEKKIDEIFDLASRIELDGGMPGKDEETRIQKSIITLLKFIEQDSDINSGPLSLHIRKLVNYLDQFRDRNKLVKHLLDIVSKGTTIPYQIEKLKEGKDFWKTLEKLLNA